MRADRLPVVSVGAAERVRVRYIFNSHVRYQTGGTLIPDTNPYTPPKSNLRAAGVVGDGGSKMFSPIQAGVAAFVGGPLAATYVIRQNFLALGNADQARKALTYGLLLSMLVVLLLPFIPDKMPNSAASIVYLVVTGQVVRKYQLTKAQIMESGRYTFQSNWRVFFVSILAVLLLVAVAVPFILALDAMGVG